MKTSGNDICDALASGAFVVKDGNLACGMVAQDIVGRHYALLIVAAADAKNRLETSLGQLRIG
ncbi:MULTISPECIES: hypothetical protein [unclassified Bradyrhizobium]|uniref:hypothetical protein n=1 Tax=unclassified Bradyrhizobium TaxID=2631580 RepID=UPI0020B2F2DF|nr:MULTISPECIES: hypothetical protein [unclassified Bradyrhizobium]MCP3396972.1 hypothetical protein [Bradyrhizobium sp. CCGB20]MCP3405485.1 hypothetical protein [Bradyrhizobium sp. CCGB01]